MGWFSEVDWGAMFTPDVPLLEIFVRGSVIYLSLFLLLRVVLKRQAGTVGLSDLLVIVLIADASQNAMAAEYHSLADGLALVGTLIFWNYVLEWLGFHFERFERLVHPAPMYLIKNGRLMRKNMKKELITEDEIMSQLRMQGFDRINQIKEACLEGDGKISVVAGKTKKKGGKPRPSGL